ncbi:MAG: tyrosine decarboxylase MfnA [Spirochaetales bacterium]|nr:tyrosine decarboxylase MfnA [Spirochaetales bacterium]
MEELGLSVDALDKELRALLQKDINFDSGTILGSMCTRPHNLAIDIFTRYIEKNIGDPGLVSSTVELEKEVIAMLSSLLSLKNGFGYVVTGGTEANILALWTARKIAKSSSSIKEVIVPDSAHFSFDKAGDLLGLRIKRIPLTSTLQVDLEKVKKAITPRTIALVGVAGTTSLGIVDPIKELSDIALVHNLYLHIDAAFGGYVLPFFKDLGFPSPQFSFRLKGISSVTIDPHKMGMAVIPSGCILYRTEDLARKVSPTVSYLSGGENAHATIVGTRSGASVLAVWSLLKHLGKAGYRTIIRRCMEITFALAEEIKSIEDVELVIDPVINVLGITSRVFSIIDIAHKLREKDWAIALFPNHIRIVIMPHVYPEHIAHFIDDLKKVLDELREQKK